MDGYIGAWCIVPDSSFLGLYFMVTLFVAPETPNANAASSVMTVMNLFMILVVDSITKLQQMLSKTEFKV